MAAANSGMVAGTYAIRGGAGNESSMSERPIYESNIAAIRTAFDYENHPERCSDNVLGFYCHVSGLGAGARLNGNVFVLDHDVYDCGIGFGGSSDCGQRDADAYRSSIGELP